MRCMGFLISQKVPLSFAAVLIFGTCSVYAGYASFLKNLSDKSPKSIGEIYQRLSDKWKLFESGKKNNTLRPPLVTGGLLTKEDIAEEQGWIGRKFWEPKQNGSRFERSSDSVCNYFRAEAYFLYLGKWGDNGNSYYYENGEFWSLIRKKEEIKREKEEKEGAFSSDKLKDTRGKIWRCLRILVSHKFLSSVFGLNFIPILIEEYNEQSGYPTVSFQCVFISENCENFREGKFEKISCDDLSKPPQRIIVKMIMKQEHAEVLKNGEYVRLPYKGGGI